MTELKTEPITATEVISCGSVPECWEGQTRGAHDTTEQFCAFLPLCYIYSPFGAAVASNIHSSPNTKQKTHKQTLQSTEQNKYNEADKLKNREEKKKEKSSVKNDGILCFSVHKKKKIMASEELKHQHVAIQAGCTQLHY